jgi:hypothetical protein
VKLRDAAQGATFGGRALKGYEQEGIAAVSRRGDGEMVRPSALAGLITRRLADEDVRHHVGSVPNA